MKISIKGRKQDSRNYDIEDIVRIINHYLENYTNLSNEEYYQALSLYYDFELEDKDYIDYINNKTGNKFDNITKINTNVIDSYIDSEGHGRDFSWWTVKVRLCLKLATSKPLEDKNYKLREIRKLISENKIYPLDCFYEKCDDELRLNKVQNDIDYLIKGEYGKLDINSECFDFIINNIRKELTTENILVTIRNYIVNLKLYLECNLNHYDYDDELTEGINNEINLVNNLIDTYNIVITNYKKNNQNNNSNQENNVISKNPIDIVINYISKLPSINREEWYDEIKIEQIVNIIENIDYNKNKEICKKIEKLVIDLGEPELCAELVGVHWINSDKMLDVVINSKDEWESYYLLRDYGEILDDNYIKKLLNIIIESKDSELNYEIAQNTYLDIDVRRHGQVVIDGGSVWYNYCFANDIEGADIRGHGEVIIKSGDVYYNYLFATNIKGADIEKHREIVMLNDKENEYKGFLVKKKTRK